MQRYKKDFEYANFGAWKRKKNDIYADIFAKTIEKVRFFAHFCENIRSYHEKAVLLHSSPGNSSPRYDAGDESGFFIFMAKNELEILAGGFL